MQPDNEARVMRQQGGTGMVVTVIAVILITAGLVAWLISSDARGVTGQALDINGGAFMS